MINEMGATPLREKLAEVLDQVRFSRQPVAVTRHGKIVAWLVPGDFHENANKVAAVCERIERQRDA
jgi:prevent-host-death family protein